MCIYTLYRITNYSKDKQEYVWSQPDQKMECYDLATILIIGEPTLS